MSYQTCNNQRKLTSLNFGAKNGRLCTLYVGLKGKPSYVNYQYINVLSGVM